MGRVRDGWSGTSSVSQVMALNRELVLRGVNWMDFAWSTWPGWDGQPITALSRDRASKALRLLRSGKYEGKDFKSSITSTSTSTNRRHCLQGLGEK